jgi:hypothetical protein
MPAKRGFVPPDEFIPLIKNTENMLKIARKKKL